MHTGIDLHPEFQSDVNFDRVEAADYRFVYIKSSEGATLTVSGYRDYQLRARVQNLRTGFYHFLRPRTDRTGGDEAEFFWSRVRGIRAGSGERAQLLRLVCDCEDTRARDVHGQAFIRQYTRQFCDRLAELAEHRPMLYTFPFYLDDWGDALGSLPLWIADPSKPDAHPRLPGSFTSWQVHQTVFGEGHTNNVPGVRGGCDEDICPSLAAIMLDRAEY